MPRSILAAGVVGLLLAAGAAGAQSEAGAQEYVQACASCHGVTGHGDGPLAESMTVAVPDLTQIANGNDGVFPLLQVIQIIDGRTGVRAHGGPMPVWGERFTVQAGDMGPYATEVEARGRILALATHLESIQE